MSVFWPLMIGAVLVLLVLAVNALRLRGSRFPRISYTPPELDEAAIAQRLAAAVRCPTVSRRNVADMDPEPFIALHACLEDAFPRVHEALTREVVSTYSLLYAWQGSEPGLEPILLMGHLDVVPVEPGTEEDWTHPPFDGVIADGYVWGRGTLDIKSSVVGILEAVETLLAEGFRPKRTVYLAFGHDEEVSGEQGARAIVDLLSARGVSLGWVLDEGGAIVTREFGGGRATQVALVGHGEKGYLTLELATEGKGGHAAMPPRATSVGIMARALTRLERSPFPVRLREPVNSLLVELGARMNPVRRLVFANLWLFRGVVARVMARDPLTASLVRTTTALTVVRAGTKDNVLAQSATAQVNFRILPGETVRSVTERVRGVIADERVRVKAVGNAWDPTEVTPLGSPAYRAIASAILAVYPEITVAPNLVNGATDSRYYVRLTEHVFRFSPIVLDKNDMGRIHGTDERISVEDYRRLVLFFHHLIGVSAEAR